MKRKHFVLWITVFSVIALLGYLVFSSRTSHWPKTGCQIVGERVVRADAPIGPYRSIVVLYRGEYHLRYRVNSRDYFLWVSSGWTDKDRQFVEDRMLSSEADGCRYHIRYNPANPGEAVAGQ